MIKRGKPILFFAILIVSLQLVHGITCDNKQEPCTITFKIVPPPDFTSPIITVTEIKPEISSARQEALPLEIKFTSNEDLVDGSCRADLDGIALPNCPPQLQGRSFVMTTHLKDVANQLGEVESAKTVTIGAQDFAKNTGKGQKTITIDTKAPVIYDNTPKSYITGIKGDFISVKLSDKGQGVKKDSVKFLLDGIERGIIGAGNEQNLVASYALPEPIEKKEHTAKFIAEDNLGNKRELEWRFFSDNAFPIEPTIFVEDGVLKEGVYYTKKASPKINISYKASPEPVRITGISANSKAVLLSGCKASEDGKVLLDCPTDSSNLPASQKAEVKISAKKKTGDAEGPEAAYITFFVVDLVAPTLSAELSKIGNNEITKTDTKDIILTYKYKEQYVDRIEFTGDVAKVVKQSNELVAGSEEITSAQKVTLTETEGEKGINITIYDIAGNSFKAEKKIELDYNGPTIEVKEVAAISATSATSRVIKDEEIGVYQTKESSVKIKGTYKKEKGESIEIFQHISSTEKKPATITPKNEIEGEFSIDVPLRQTSEVQTITLVVVDTSNRQAVPNTASIKVLKDDSGPAATLGYPESGAINSDSFVLKISTSEPSEDCKATYVNAEGSRVTATMEADSTSRVFSLATEKLSQNLETKFDIVCRDIFGNTKTTSIGVTVDNAPPKIDEFKLTNQQPLSSSTLTLKKYIITTNPKTRVEAATNEESKCRYSLSDEDYYSMSSREDFDSEVFKKVHTSQEIQFSDRDKKIYYIACIDRAGNPTEQKAILDITVNREEPIIIVSKTPDGRTPDKRPKIIIGTDASSKCRINQEFAGAGPIKDFFKAGAKDMLSQDGKQHSFPAKPEDWPADFEEKREYKFFIKCEDNAKVRKNVETTLTVIYDPNAVIELPKPSGEIPFIILAEPKYGVSKEHKFDFAIKTKETVQLCKYEFDSAGRIQSFANFADFDETQSIENGNLFRKKNFDEIKEGDASIHSLYIKCSQISDGKEKISDGRFELSVDTTMPQFKNAFASPSIVADKGLETSISIQTDEHTICRYGSNQIYKEMDKFEGFDKGEFNNVHEQKIKLQDKVGEHLYYIICENKAGIKSEAKELVIRFDPSAELMITSRTQMLYNGTEAKPARVQLKIDTNRIAECTYKFKDKEELLTADSKNLFHSKEFLLGSGTHTFSIICTDLKKPPETKTSSVSVIVDGTPPFMESVEDGGEFSCINSSLKVKWSGKDLESGIGYFEYSLNEKRGNKQIRGWSKSTSNDEWVVVRDLELAKGATYHFSIRPYNALSAQGLSKDTDGIIVDSSKCKKECPPNDKTCVLDTCQRRGDCPKDTPCNDNTECDSDFCNQRTKKCDDSSCSDNVKNGNETDTDCGGNCRHCSLGKRCTRDSHCSSGNCDNGRCLDQDPCKNRKVDPLETDVDCGGGRCPECNIDKKCSGDLDCERGLECREKSCKPKERTAARPTTQITPSADQKDTDGDGIPDDWEKRNGLDSNDPKDANKDTDQDLLTNIDEYRQNTNPTLRDTDGDGATDKEELDAGTNPNDPESRQKSKISLIVPLIIGIILLLGGAAFIGFMVLKKKEETGFEARPRQPSTAPQIRAPPGRIRTTTMHPSGLEYRHPPPAKPGPEERRIAEQFRVPTPKPEEKKLSSAVLQKQVEKEEDVFSKLAKISSASKETKPEAKKSQKEGALSKLAEIAKEGMPKISEKKRRKKK